MTVRCKTTLLLFVLSHFIFSSSLFAYFSAESFPILFQFYCSHSCIGTFNSFLVHLLSFMHNIFHLFSFLVNQLHFVHCLLSSFLPISIDFVCAQSLYFFLSLLAFVIAQSLPIFSQLTCSCSCIVPLTFSYLCKS